MVEKPITLLKIKIRTISSIACAIQYELDKN